MNILILGGTAFFGKDIAREFHEAGHKVTLFTRGNTKPDDLPPHQHINGNRGNLDDLKRAADAGPWDVVIDNLAYNAADSQLALEAFKAVRRFILTSTISVYGFVRDRFSQPLMENMVDFSFNPPEENPNDIHWKYARGKLEAERVVINQDKVPWTIVRPSIVYGPFDVSQRSYWYMSRLLKGEPILLANGGMNSFRLSYCKDVAKSYLLLAERTHTFQKTYNVAQQEILTLREFLEESARALQVEPQLVNVPGDLIGELGGPYAMKKNWIQDISLACAELEFQPTPWPVFAAITSRWFKECWKGDESELYSTREKELDFAQHWISSTSNLSFKP